MAIMPDALHSVEEYARSQIEKGRPFPLRLSEIPQFENTTWIKLKSEFTSGRYLVRTFNFSTGPQAMTQVFAVSIFMGGAFGFVYQVLFWLMLAAAIGGVIISFFWKWWVFLIGFVAAWYLKSVATNFERQAMVDAAVAAEPYFCFLFNTGLIALVPQGGGPVLSSNADATF